MTENIIIAIIGSMAGAITALAAGYVTIRKLGVDLRQGHADAKRQEIENEKLREKLEEERDALVASTIERVVKSASESLLMSEKACQDRISALESKYNALETMYNNVLAEHEKMKITYQNQVEQYKNQVDDLLGRIGNLLVDNKKLEEKISAVAKDVQTITGKNLIKKTA